MNILFIVPYTPNLIRVRSYNIIRGLSERGHQVTVATLWTNEQERQDIESLKQICWRVYAKPMPPLRSLANCLPALFTSAPLQASFSWHSGFARQLADLVASHENHLQSRFDIIHVEHLRGARYGLSLSRAKLVGRDGVPSSPAIIWDSVDCIAELFKQACRQSKGKFNHLPIRFDLHRTARFESWLLDQFDHVLVTSPLDKNSLLANYSGNNHPSIAVLPNGVDLTYFNPRCDNHRETATLVISGKMSYHANTSMVIHFITDIMPSVWASKPDVKLWIVGKDPPREVVNLASHPGITVTGTVPDIRPYLCQATIGVSPIVYGAGIQNKVLEGMACGTPMITTQQAVSALSVRPGREVVTAEDPETFSRAILSLLDNPEEQMRLGLAGRKYVEEHHRWENIVCSLEEIYSETLAKNRTQYQIPKSP